MLFGHNSNVTVAGITYHVQTEERGTTHALIDTTIYFRGHVIHRRTNNYLDLLPLDAAREQTLKSRVEEQHRSIIEEIRSGKLKLTVPKDEMTASLGGAIPALSASNVLHLELLNARTWLSGKRALLLIAVRDQAEKPVQGAKVIAKVEGAAQPAEFSGATGSSGQARLEFEMPRLAGSEAALVIEASNGKRHTHLRFQLRAKPHVPPTG